MLGRGRPPVYQIRSFKESSAHKPIEHMIWNFPNPVAIAGSESYSTLWAIIAGMFNVIANAATADHEATMEATLAEQMRHLGNNHDRQITLQTASLKAVVMFVEFTLYNVQATSSPRIPSLNKLKIEPQQWSYNLSYPFHLQHSECKALATEA